MIDFEFDWDTETITHEELFKREMDYWNNLSETERYCKLMENESSFEQYVLSMTKPFDIIEIYYNSYTYKVIGNNKRKLKLERIFGYDRKRNKRNKC